MHHVIIGNSAAAIGAVEAIRKTDKASKITLVTDEAHHSYSRPAISYYLLGKVSRERMNYRDADFYEKNNVDFMPNSRVVSLDAGQKKVSLKDGQAIAYDRLLVATGSSPFVPPMEGLEGVKNKFCFQSLDDALSLETAINEKSRVLVVGAGLIGLKCAEGILDKVASIAVVDLAPRVLSSILDDGAAAMVKRQLEAKGMTFYLGDSVDRFEGNAATLKSGKKAEFDVLVLAVGVRPNTDLVKEAGGNVGRGITVNEYLQTSLPDVYSAGDCTECMDASQGVVKIMALLPNAYMQGEHAGYNMSGIKIPFNKAIPYNSIGFFKTQIISAGTYIGEEFVQVTDNTYRKFFYADNKLNGFILIGEKEAGHPAFANAGIYTSLIREKTPLDSLDYEQLFNKAGLMPFSAKVRKEKLAAEV